MYVWYSFCPRRRNDLVSSLQRGVAALDSQSSNIFAASTEPFSSPRGDSRSSSHVLGVFFNACTFKVGAHLCLHSLVVCRPYYTRERGTIRAGNHRG